MASSTLRRNPGPPGYSVYKVWAFRLLALLIPVIFFAGVEWGLRTAGFGYPTPFLIPSSERSGTLEENYRFAWRFFPKALARTPQPILVAERKPTDIIRIVILGGSAAMGDPEPAYGMPRVLEVLLEQRYADLNFEVVNCAVTAVNSHVVREMARDCRQLDADAWVVYLGNNEVHGPFGAGTVFGGGKSPLWLSRAALALQRTRIGQGAFQLLRRESSVPKDWGGLEMFLERQVRHDNPALDRVYSNYARNLSAIIGAADVRTRVLVSTVATNLKDFPPFVSHHREGLSNKVAQRWRDLFQQGCDLQRQEDWSAALEAFASCAQVDEEHAELEFRQGQCLLAMNRPEAAMGKFLAARNHDALRFRADSRINQLIRSVAKSSRAHLVDAEKELAAAMGPILGDEVFFEHVHFTFLGNYLLAKSIAQQLSNLYRWNDSEPQFDALWVSAERCASLLGRSLFHQRLTLREMRSRLNEPPFSQQFVHEERDARLGKEIEELSRAMTREVGQQTIGQYHQLIANQPHDWIIRKQFALLLDSTGDLNGAADQFFEIVQLLPHHPESHFRLGAQLNRINDWERAERSLRRALQLRPDFARARNSLGICLSHQGRYAESYEQFRRATEIQPTFAEAFMNWGLVLMDRGQRDAAVEKYQMAVKADEQYVPVRVHLGKAYVDLQDLQGALPHYEAISKLRPKDVAAQLNLGLLYLQLENKTIQAQQQLRRVLELDPGNPTAQRTMRQLSPPPNPASSAN